MAGNVQVKLADEKGGLVPIQVLDNEDGTYSADYVAPSEGNYKVNINVLLHELIQNEIIYIFQFGILKKVLYPFEPIHFAFNRIIFLRKSSIFF